MHRDEHATSMVSGGRPCARVRARMASALRHTRAGTPAVGLLAALALLCAAPGPASAAEAAGVSLHASLAPDRLGASTAFTLAFRFSGVAEAVPPALRSVAVELPAGLRIDMAGVAICAPARLRRRGPSGCPPSSLVGRGHALLDVHAGTEPIAEEATLWVLRGPQHGGLPSFEIFGQGYTPLYESAVSPELLETASAPYGYRTVTSVPAIPTLMYEPNASFASLSLTFGGKQASRPGAISAPHSCPAGGFPFAAQVSYANGESASTTATVPCP
jgi:hypothetical protein